MIPGPYASQRSLVLVSPDLIKAAAETLDVIGNVASPTAAACHAILLTTPNFDLVNNGAAGERMWLMTLRCMDVTVAAIATILPSTTSTIPCYLGIIVSV